MFAMLAKHFKMFSIIFAVCCFGIVHSQAPFAFNSPYSSSSQSVSYSGPGSSSIASGGTATAYSRTGSSSVASSGTAAAYSGTGASYVANNGIAVSSSRSVPALSPVPPTVSPVPDPNLELFAHSLTQLLSTSPVLNAVPDFVIPDAYSIIFKLGKSILERGNVVDPSLVGRTAATGRDVGVFSRDLYLSAIAHSLAKLLSLNNVLTQETVLTYPRLVLSYVEDYGIKNGIHDPESVISAVKNGVFDFGTSIGINNTPNLKLMFLSFGQELKDLASGAKQ